MLLVHRPQPFPSPAAAFHRRHPSAPAAVVVQATRIPGLLTLSKPSRAASPRPQQIQRQQQQRSPRSKAVQRSTPGSLPQLNATDDKKRPSTPTPGAGKGSSLIQMATPAPSPERPLRGRQHAKVVARDKEKSLRSTSLSTTRQHPGRRYPTHQPSPSPPPHTAPSQAEAPKQTHPSPTNVSKHRNNASSNNFDPFLSSDSDSPPSSNPLVVRAPPTLSKPTGKLARRRQRAETPTPGPKPNAVPVPRTLTNNPHPSPSPSPILSRSEPPTGRVPFPSRPSPPRRAATAAADWDSFPICDDSNDDDELEDSPVPSTVSVSKPFFDDALRSAPLTSSFTGYHSYSHGHSLSSTPRTPPRKERPRAHQRTTSEGVFRVGLASASATMSDSDVSASDELRKVLFAGLTPGRSTSAQAARERKEQAERFFASSTFQNSPSPDELPPPSFSFK